MLPSFGFVSFYIFIMTYCSGGVNGSDSLGNNIDNVCFTQCTFGFLICHFPMSCGQLTAIETVCVLVPPHNSHVARAWSVFPPHHCGPIWGGFCLIRISTVQGPLGSLSAQTHMAHAGLY